MSSKQPRFFEENARAIVNNGYSIIPRTKEAKSPVDSEHWRRFSWVSPSESQLDDWIERFPDNGISMACGRSVVCFDIDEDDEAAAALSRADVERVCGPTSLVRIGKSPRLAMLYRAAEPIVSVRLPRHDILGMGVTLACLGLHPTTGQAYRWLGASNPTNFKAQDLPPVTNDMVSQVADAWARRALGLETVTFRLEVDLEFVEDYLVVFGGSSTQLIKQLCYRLFRGRKLARAKMEKKYAAAVVTRSWGLVLVPELSG